MDSMTAALRAGATGFWTTTQDNMTPEEHLAAKRSFLKSKLKNLQINLNNEPLLRIYYARGVATTQTKFCKDNFEMIFGCPLHGYFSDESLRFFTQYQSTSPPV